MSAVLAYKLIKAEDFSEARLERNMTWDFCPDLFSIPSAYRIPLENDQIAEVPDLRSLRSLSRAGLILCRVAMDCWTTVKAHWPNDLSRVGLYCAVDQGPLDYNLINGLAQSKGAERGETLLRTTMPKQIFKMYPNYSTNQLGIMLGIQGPMYTFTNMKFGALQALEQAEFDLWNNIVDIALVCSANSLEDPVASLRMFRQCNSAVTLSEGGAALVLKKSEKKNEWTDSRAVEKSFYGIADPVVKILKEKNRGT